MLMTNIHHRRPNRALIQLPIMTPEGWLEIKVLIIPHYVPQAKVKYGSPLKYDFH